MRTECEYISKRQDRFSSRETERSDLGGARWGGGVEEEGSGREGRTQAPIPTKGVRVP